MDVESRIAVRDDLGRPGPPADPVRVPVFVNPARQAAAHAELTEHRRLARAGHAGDQAETHGPPLSAAGTRDSPQLPAGSARRQFGKPAREPGTRDRDRDRDRASVVPGDRGMQLGCWRGPGQARGGRAAGVCGGNFTFAS